MTLCLVRRALALAVLATVTGGATEPAVTSTDLFVSGNDGYATYRIPALVRTPQGTLLAACEGRKNNSDDWGRIDLLSRFSADGGRTWEPMRRLVGQEDLPRDLQHNAAAAAMVVGGTPKGFTINNPTWVACTATGETLFLYCAEYFRCFVIASRDGGRTFGPARELTAAFETFRTERGYPWKAMAPGPGHGIELSSGRLVVPVWMSSSTGGHPHRPSVAATIYSDDHGATWQAGEIVAGRDDDVPNASEATLAEVAPGSVMINLRSDSPRNRRAVAWSPDGATHWTRPVFDDALLEPVCMAGSIVLSAGPRRTLLFSNPASVDIDPQTAVGAVGKARRNLTVRQSHDGGRTWSNPRTLFTGPSAYSDLVLTNDGAACCLYEAGAKNPYERLTLARWSETASVAAWTPLPPLPDRLGFSGSFAGTAGGALLVGAGTNFPDRPPWEKGTKAWHDDIFVLRERHGAWEAAGRLPAPVSYAATVNLPQGFLLIGGTDEKQNHAGVRLVRWDGAHVAFERWPDLPFPLARMAAAQLGRKVLVAGGLATPDVLSARRVFLALDLDAVAAGWQELEPWPGPARAMAVAGAVNGTFYLFGGAGGTTQREFLRDAFAWNPARGWRRLADLPHPAAAAPPLAVPREDGGLMVIGGDDGTQAALPIERYQEFPRRTQVYDPVQDHWSVLEDEPPFSLVATALTFWDGSAVVAGGEVRPGVRSPVLWATPLPVTH